MTDPDPTETDDDFDGVIERLYEVAVDPLRFESLLDHWEAAIAPHRGTDTAMPRMDVLEGHFARADRLLADVTPAPARDAVDAAFDALGVSAAMTLTRAGRIGRLNGAARSAFGCGEGDDLSALPLAAGEADILRAAILRILSANAPLHCTVPVRRARGDRVTLFHLRDIAGGDGPPVVLAVASELGWPAGFDDLMRDAFALTPAETKVMRALAGGVCVADIATARGRSVGTVRAQVKALLSKTGTRSQVELVRLTLSTMELAQFTGDRAAQPDAAGSEGSGLVSVPYRRMRQDDGRTYDYIVLGDPGGRPVCYLPTDFGLIRWPAVAEAEAARRGIAVVVPIRAGYGGSDPYPRGTDVATRWARDVLALWDHLGAAAMPVIANSSDSYFAYRLHTLAPERIPLIVGCSALLPLTRPAQFERMDKWHRFIMAGARYTPHLLPFMVKAGFALAHRLGREGFARAVYGQSRADLAVLADPDLAAPILAGSEVTLSATHSAHRAFALETICSVGEDWSADLSALRDAVSAGTTRVRFISGTQDPLVAPATLAEFREDYPWIDFRVHEDAGQLVLFRRWRDVLDLVEGAQDGIGPLTPSGG